MPKKAHLIVFVLIFLYSNYSSAGLINYTGGGDIDAVYHQDFLVDLEDNLLFSFSLNPDETPFFTDTGRAEYNAGNFEAFAGGYHFKGDDSSVITQDVNSGGTVSWLLTSKVIVDSTHIGWFQLSLSQGPAIEHLNISPLAMSDYSQTYFATNFGSDNLKTNFSGSISQFTEVSEPSSILLFILGFLYLAYKTNSKRSFQTSP